MERRTNLIIAKNTNEIAKSIFGHFLFVNTLFILQLADISRYLELLHQLLSACLFDACCNYNYRIFAIIGGFSHFQAWGSQFVDCLTFSSLLYGWWILQAVLIARVSQCSHLILPLLPTTTFSISFVIFKIYIGLSNGYFIVRWLADFMYKISPYIVFVLHPIWLLQ